VSVAPLIPERRLEAAPFGPDLHLKVVTAAIEERRAQAHGGF
jgi:hypothetical protein